MSLCNNLCANKQNITRTILIAQCYTALLEEFFTGVQRDSNISSYILLRENITSVRNIKFKNSAVLLSQYQPHSIEREISLQYSLCTRWSLR